MRRPRWLTSTCAHARACVAAGTQRRSRAARRQLLSERYLELTRRHERAKKQLDAVSAVLQQLGKLRLAHTGL